MDPLLATIGLGAGLLICGFLLGKGPWTRTAEFMLLKLLYDEKLLDPKVVVQHFTEKAQREAAAKIKK